MSKTKRPKGQGWARLGNISFYMEPNAPRVKLMSFDWSDGEMEPMVQVELDAGKKDFWGQYWFVVPLDEAQRILAELQAAIDKSTKEAAA